ncbi:MAG: hypothetical protein WAZ34_05755 [Rhodocyclaceae bacterium]
MRLPVLAAMALASAGLFTAVHAEPGAASKKMGFFVTSAGLGKGADLGGLAGAFGEAFPGGQDTTCGNWTKSGSDGSVQVGHHDRLGLNEKAAAQSWNHAHPSRGGCSQEALRSSGGDGLFYCFAVK